MSRRGERARARRAASRAFAAEHERRYGYRDPDAEVELVSIRVAVDRARRPTPRPQRGAGRRHRARLARRARFGGDWLEAEILRGEPAAGVDGRGPVRVRAARGDAGAAARLARRGRRRRDDRRGARVSGEPVSASTRSPSRCWSAALRAACDEMGAVLIRSAYSPNIKERHDCSTALFDAAGELVMQAEHIPVHLGSMPDAVAAVLGVEQRPGDALDPQRPLSRRHPPARHHPDLARCSRGGELLGFAASRAHHADIGGPTPGGMPADSTALDEEGVVIPPTRGDDETSCASSPSRCARREQRLADLRAQRAANLTGGARASRELVERHGRERLRAGMAEILDYAERRTRAALERIPDGAYEAEDVLEGDGERRAPRCACGSASTATRCGSTSRAPRRRSRATSTARSR